MNNFLVLLFLLMLQNSIAQVFRYEKIDKKYDQNITVEKISEDELHSTYLITVVKHVPLHFHKNHSENIIVLEGEAIMKIGNDTLNSSPKDQITIPKRTLHEVIKVLGKKPLKVISVQSPKFDPKDRFFIKKQD